nr:MAG TPA: MAEBL protein [Bacteriophage sp.]
MAWTAEQMAQKRAKLQKKTNAAAGGAEPLSQRKSADSPPDSGALGSTGNSVSDNKSNTWTAEKMDEKRAALQTQKQQTGTDLYSTALEDYRTRNNLGFADAMDSRSDELNRQKVTVSPAGNTLGTWYGQQAQKLKNSYAEYSQPEAFDQANQWFDQPRNQELVNKLLEKKSNYTSYAETGTSRNGASAGDGSIDPFRTTGIKGKVGNTYSTADLKKLGYTDTEIRQAREYLDTMEEIPEWKQLARRTANTVGGVADTVAAAPLMGAEYLVQAGKNIRQSSENRKALEAELARNPREKNLYDQLMETDMDYQPKYSTGDLLQQGFTRQEIEDMRSRIAGTEAKGGIDTEKSVGYQLYNRGQQLTGAAQSGLTDVQRTVQGVATSAAENLAVAAINPAAVLPVLSAQGAADAMGKSAAKGESAGKALAGGVAKFGAGWAINSVGAADLARTMGADYARNSVAGAVADKIRALAGDSAFAAAHPAVANAISGGIDNAMQAFVETYADKAIDAALGDSEAAQTMFTTDTLVQALEAGLSGGASGALGGAVGTGLSRMNAGDSSLRGNVERYAAQDEYEQALKEHQRREELAREPEPLSQRVSADSPPNSGALGMSVESDGTEKGSADLKAAGPAAEGSGIVNETQVNDDPAVHTAETATNRQAMVENAGESVESSTETAADGAEPLSQRISADSPPSMGAIGRTGNVELTAQNGADRQAVMQSGPVEESTIDGMDSSNSPMRETYGMEAPRTEGQKQARTEQVLRSWKVGEKAAQEISRKQPEGVDSDRYAAAASTLYRLGQMEDVKTFDQALELAGTGSGMAANVNYVLGNLKGRNALEIAYTYGRDAAETRWAKSQLGGTLTEQSLTGRGETIYKGTLRNANDAGSQVIELNAAATGTTAVMKNGLMNNQNVKAYVDTKTAQIFFGDSAQDTFGTVLHEDYHWYNALDSEGAKTLQDHALLYLARSSGFETVDEMIREKMADYAQQNLTYEEAAEELVGDAWRGIFSNESDFKRWVEFQRGQAEKNSGRAGTIRTVMNRVKEMLGGIISRAKEVLTLDPDNRAALKAQRLAENERRILQDEYFAHAEKAMDNLRSAKENAAALKTESAAEGRNIRFSIQKDADGESYIKIDEDILNGVPQEDWKTVVKQAIKERYPNGFERNGWTILNHKDGRSEFVRSKSTMALQRTNEETYADKMRMAANLDEIIKTADEVYREPANHKNAEAFNRGKIKIVVGQNAYEADVLTAFKANDREIFYDIVDIKSTNNKTSMRTHVESKDSRSSLQGGFTEPSGKAHMESEDSGSRGSEGSIYQESADTVLKTEEGGERPSFPAKNSIAQENAESKGNSEPVKKSVRFQLSDGSAGNVDELAALQKESRELEHQQNALKTERTNWLNSAEVKEIEAKRKSLGLFSAEAKEFKASEEYQAYLAKRKDFNQRGAELENRIGEVNNALREAHAKLETQRNEQKQKQQAVYDAKAKEAGGAAKYRRQLAVEQFGTTSEFERAGYILPDGQMLDFARNDKTRDTDHREIMSVFGPAEVSEGTDALNKFLADGNVRVMAEAPGVDLAADKAPTAAQLEQIREMVGSLGSEQRKFTLDISTTDGRVAASKEYSGRIDADRVVREIRDYYKTGELPAESSLARFRYQLAAKAEQAERDARKNTQRQASRAIADNSAAMETLAQMMGVTHGVRISQDSIDGLAVRWTKANGSRADRTKIAGETRALVEYMTADGASMSKASALSETIADEILSGATYRNTELWDEYPEYHDLSYTVNKDGPAKAELVKRYGTWSEAVAEARRHGVKLRQAEGVRDGNPAEVYESIVNDTRAMGGTKEGAAALFRGAAQAAGVDGAASMESTEWLDVLMNVHDAIKPRMMSRFADAAEYEDAKVELADRMLGDILSVPEMTDAQAIFDGFQRWQRQAVAAAVGEENAEQALKDLRKVQKEQNREFNRRMYENSRNGSRDEALRQWTEQQKRNEKAEKLLDQNLDTLGLDITNYGDMAEKLDVLKEAYEREWKAEKKRLKEERQQMLDEIRLENKQLKRENWNLSHQVAGEQRRADRAEWQLIHQENELLEWEQENQRKAQEWQEKQAERNAIAITAAQQQRDEDIAIAKKLAEKRVQKARDGRQKDELKRAIRNNAAQLNQMVLRPAKDKYVQPRLILRALEVAKLADMTLLNQNAVNRLDALANSIRAEYGDADHPVVTEMSNDWEQSGIANLIDALKADLNASKQAQLDRLNQQLTEAEALPDSEKAEMLRDRLRKRIRETENRTYLPMTVDQMRMLKAITTSTLHVIRTANKTLSLQQAEEVDKIAGEAAVEVNRSKGNDGKFRRMLTRYNLDMLGGTRVFRMLGGYAKNSQMEKLGTMLNDGQRRQTEILVEGTHLFDNVTGKKNLKQMEQFAGKGAKLVDLGLKDNRGKAAPLTHAQMCSLYMHLQNADSREHLLNGGLTIPDAEEYNRGNIVEAYQKGQTVRIGMLTDSEGKPMADTIVSAIEKNLTDYDRAWIGSMENFFGSYTTDLINETSMKLLGYQRATVKNYYPIAVNKKALATQIEGLHLDATIEGRGFLKNRVKSPQPILLEECNNVVQRSLRDTAAYAGLAPAIRDVQKVLNSRIETEDGLKVLKNGILEEKWGSDAVNYVDELLTDLQTPGRKTRKSSMTALGKLRGNYAGAILTLNPGVAIAQAASLPTAGAVLGADTMAAVVPFVKNFSHKQRAALEAEIAQHGDVLLRYRLRGSQRGELASIGVSQGAAEKAMDKLPKWVTGWINSMDEITVAALWEGSKRYVEHHTNEFAEGAATKGSEAYWEAVNKMYQRVIEETQPNYTTMQRAGIQRSDNELVRTLTMFTTQRFQNYGILADAVLAYNAQRERSHADPTEENRAELKRAGKNLNRAVTSQIVQTAVFAAMKIGADFLLHRWDREQDENGDITAGSLLKRYADLYVGSAAGTFLYGSELYSFVGNVAGGKDYDVVSAPNLSAVNDLGTEAMRLYKLLATDTGEMDEEDLEAYHEKLRKAALTFMEDGLELKGLPAGNAAKLLEAAWKWGGNAAYAVTGAKYGEKLSLNSLPASATGQYDRLYNAIVEGDTDNASGAMAKLEAMGKDEKTIASQLKNRLKKYSPEVEQAARARNEGKDSQRQELTKQLVREMYETLGIREGVKADAKKRAWVIDLVTEAIESKAEELYKGGTEGSVYDALTEAVDTGRTSDVQDEIDRLRTAGKDDNSIKPKITAAVKEEYLAGNDHDREKLKKLLTSLTKEDGTAMYEEKNFAQWVKDAAKKEEQAKNSKDEWAGVR